MQAGSQNGWKVGSKTMMMQTALSLFLSLSLTHGHIWFGLVWLQFTSLLKKSSTTSAFCSESLLGTRNQSPPSTNFGPTSIIQTQLHDHNANLACHVFAPTSGLPFLRTFIHLRTKCFHGAVRRQVDLAVHPKNSKLASVTGDLSISETDTGQCQ